MTALETVQIVPLTQLDDGTIIVISAGVALEIIVAPPFAHINYGTGKDVSDEDINDAKPPLQIKWYDGS